ncbi:MAG TPA: GTP-binding protein, partial [Plasticicumulans sp.]|nr:GTP-binding protein [Plasticicumulans sp.]
MPIPSYLLTGLLGSGKTTVLRALLAQAPAGSRPAVLVNDFGTVGIDAAVLAGAGGAGEITVREVGGGCVCCTAAASLRAAIPA